MKTATARLPFSLKIKNYNLKSIDDKILLRGAGRLLRQVGAHICSYKFDVSLISYKLKFVNINFRFTIVQILFMEQSNPNVVAFMRNVAKLCQNRKNKSFNRLSNPLC